MAQHAGGVADQRHWLTDGDEQLDQLDRVRIFGQVPHRAVSARVEKCVVILLLHAAETHRLVELCLGGGVLLEIGA